MTFGISCLHGTPHHVFYTNKLTVHARVYKLVGVVIIANWDILLSEVRIVQTHGRVYESPSCVGIDCNWQWKVTLLQWDTWIMSMMSTALEAVQLSLL